TPADGARRRRGAQLRAGFGVSCSFLHVQWTESSSPFGHASPHGIGRGPGGRGATFFGVGDGGGSDGGGSVGSAGVSDTRLSAMRYGAALHVSAAPRTMRGCAVIMYTPAGSGSLHASPRGWIVVVAITRSAPDGTMTRLGDMS